MSEHVTDLLGAYVDGELHGLRLQQVEEHLTGCAVCRKDLAELRGLSSLLQKSVPMQSFTPTDRFVANLNLQLNARHGLEPSRRLAPAPTRKPLEFLWWLAPVGVIGAWIFLQSVFTLSSVISTANLAGLLGTSTSWLQNGSGPSLWFSTTMSLFGNQIQGNSRTIFDLLNDFSLFGSNITVQLLWQAGIALVYWIWLALWWNRRRPAAAPRLPKMLLHS